MAETQEGEVSEATDGGALAAELELVSLGADVPLVHHSDGRGREKSVIICHYPSLSFILMILRAGLFNGISFSKIIQSKGLLNH